VSRFLPTLKAGSVRVRAGAPVLVGNS